MTTIWQRLAEPFPADVVKERQGPKKHADVCTKQYGQCTQRHMMLSYVDARDVAVRLDDVLTPAGWAFEAYAVANTNVVHGHLSIHDGDQWAVREDHGYPNSDDDAEPLKSATSDALKRCAVMFGIGRHLYDDNHPSRPATAPQTAPAPRQAPAPRPAALASAIGTPQHILDAARDSGEEPPWPVQTLDDGPLAQAVALFPDATVDESHCPDHAKAYKSNSRGYYCASKIGDDPSGKTLWCQRQPSRAWQAKHEIA